MRTGIRHSVVVMVISCLMGGVLIAAEEGGESGKNKPGQPFPGAGELKAYQAKQDKVRKEFMEKQREEGKAFHESLKDQKAVEALPAIISQRNSQFSKTKSFMDGLYSEFVAYVKEVMAKHEVPADKQAEFIKKHQEHRDAAVARHEEIHKKLIAALEALKGKEDLTWEEIKSTIKSILPEHDSKPGEGKGRDKDKGKGKGEGKNKKKDK